MPRLDDPVLVKTQYQDDARLNDRLQLYARYSTQTQSWYEWVFAHLQLQSGERVLEIGCGNGALWESNRHKIPDGLELALIDNAAGMLTAARTTLSEIPFSIDFEEMAAESLSYPAESFDVVIANHMLYHVSEPSRVIAEAHRVLKPGGRFYVTTNDWSHQQELRELFQRFKIPSAMPPPGRDSSLFDIETAAETLSEKFPGLRVFRRMDLLDVTEVEPIVRYIRSMLSPEIDLSAVTSHLQRQIKLLGIFRITANAGLIEATVE